MITANQINILDETEVPFNLESGYGSDYKIDLNKSTGGLKDITEIIEDESYIIGIAKNGDVYNKNSYTHRYTRNNFITAKTGNVYSETGGSSGRPIMYKNTVPGYQTVSFERDMLALVWNERATSSSQYRPRYTGDAYCIKSITTSIITGSSYDRAVITMNAKEIDDSSYIDYEMCTIENMERNRFDTCLFLPDSHTRINLSSGEINSVLTNEAHSIIFTDIGLAGWMSQLFISTADSGATVTKIRNYILNHMPYGAILIEPQYVFALKRKNYGDMVLDWGQAGNNRKFRISSILNPTYRNPSGKYVLPGGDSSKQWIIPFSSEEEYHAAMCTKEAVTFPYH